MYLLAAAPFSTGYLMAVDTIRLLGCVITAGVFGLYIGQAFTNKRLDFHDRAKSLGLCLVLLLVFFTNVDRLGHDSTWRLAISFPGVLLLAWGNSSGKRPFHMVGK